MPDLQNIHRQFARRLVQSVFYFQRIMTLRTNILAWLLICLCGCSLAVQEPELPSASEINLPAIGIFPQQPDNELSDWCHQQAEPCHITPIHLIDIAQQLQDSGGFPLVSEQPGADYEFLLASARNDNHIFVHVLLAWQGLPLHTYKYQFKAAQNPYIDVALTKALLKDVRQDNAFSASYLAKALNADNYTADLWAPAQIASFYLSHKRVYNDPFQGSVLTYNNPDFNGDKVEVSIYPIPASDLSNRAALIAEETNKLRDNLFEFARQHQLPPLTMTADTSINWTQQGQDFQGYYLDASIISPDSEPFYAAYFFFIQQDKIVKFTTTFPSGIAMNFVKQALPQMQIPEESAFMARLRRP